MTVKEKIALARQAHSKKATAEDKAKLKEATKGEKTMGKIDKATSMTTADRNKAKESKHFLHKKRFNNDLMPKKKSEEKKVPMGPLKPQEQYVKQVKSGKGIDRKLENKAVFDYILENKKRERERIRKAKAKLKNK